MPKTILLKKLTLDGFKGMTRVFLFGDGVNEFYGANGTGKTTLLDAVKWCLTGKDSQGRQDFEIKALSDGKTDPEQKHSVESSYLIDDQEVTIKRVYYETWSKQGERKGNTTDYFIDGIKTTASKFISKISSIFGPNYFICSDISTLPGMHWKEVRDILSGMFDEKKEGKKIIDEIEGFRDILGTMTLEDAKTFYDQKRSEVKTRLSEINPLIKEYQNKELAIGLSLDECQNETKEKKEAFDNAEQELSLYKQGIPASKNLDKIKELSDTLAELTEQFEREKAEAKRDEWNRKNELDEANFVLAGYDSKLQKKIDERLSLLDEYNKLKISVPGEFPETCEYCGTFIDKEQHDFIMNYFNLIRSEKLKANIEKGTAVKAEIENLRLKIKESKAEIKRLGNIIFNPIINASTTDAIKEIEIKINHLKLQDANQKAEEIPEELTKAVEDAKKSYQEAVENEAKVKAAIENRERLEGLVKEKNDLSDENDKAETFKVLLDMYNKALSDSIEEPVNKRFKLAYFQMFDTLETGDVKPACVLMDKRKNPYLTALSTGERIQVGVDICSSLQKFFGLSAPIWIDNAESVTDPILTKGQLIILNHHKDFATLTKKEQ